MFASKAFVQLIANPFVGPLTNKYNNIISPISMETFALVDILTYRVFFLTGAPLKVSDYIVNPIKKVPSVKIYLPKKTCVF